MSRYSLLPVRNARVRVGLLGGSFNPAHEGHRYISLEAIKRLKLDYVVWLVSPQNPLKKLNIRNSLKERRETASNIKNSNKIIISDIEKNFKNTYTINTLKSLKRMHKQVSFIWIMGADNMMQVHKWYKWKEIFKEVFVAVFDRNEHANKLAKCKAAYNFPNHWEITEANNKKLKPGRWCFFKIKKNPLSSTEIRNRLNNERQEKKY
jgi:nicotinate-nucleotide adenylyltransferase